MTRECKGCGASLPMNARSCALCGGSSEPARPTGSFPCLKCGRPVAAQLPRCQICGEPNYGGGDGEAAPSPQSPASEAPPPAALDVARLRSGALRAAQALAFTIGLPAVLPGLLVRTLFARRGRRAPLAALWIPGILLAAFSYLSFEIWEGPGTGVVFPLLLVSSLACAGLAGLQVAGGRRDMDLARGAALLAVGGLLLHAGAALSLQKSHAPRHTHVVVDAPLPLAPGDVASRPERLLHLQLLDARFDASLAAWRTDTTAVGVFTPAEASPVPIEGDLAEIQARAQDLLGSRVRITGGQLPGLQVWVRDAPGGPVRLYQDLALSTSSRVFLLASGPRDGDAGTKMEGVLDAESATGILASIPRTARELFAAVTPRGIPANPKDRLVLVTDPSPQRRCAPVVGTDGRLWIQAAPGGEFPAEGAPLEGVLETPEPGALRSLELNARSLGMNPAGPPRVLVLESVAAYCSARGIPQPVPETFPWATWAALLLGALLALAGIFLAMKSP